MSAGEFSAESVLRNAEAFFDNEVANEFIWLNTERAQDYIWDLYAALGANETDTLLQTCVLQGRTHETARILNLPEELFPRTRGFCIIQSSREASYTYAVQWIEPDASFTGKLYPDGQVQPMLATTVLAEITAILHSQGNFEIDYSDQTERFKALVPQLADIAMAVDKGINNALL